MRKKKKTTKVSETLLAPGPVEIAAGEFKARCLELMDIVNEGHREFVITKRGKPVAKLVPVAAPARRKSGFGLLKGMGGETIGDIIAPVYTKEELGAFEASEAHLYDE